MPRVLIFDTETTSLIANSAVLIENQPCIIEFCGEVLENNDTVGEFYHQLIHPGIEITDETTKITGIKRSDLENKPYMRQCFNDIDNLISSADCVVAHNLSYDLQVVDFEAKRLERTINWPEWRTCTVEATLHYKGYRLSLSALHEHLFGVKFEGAHRANVDVAALRRCYIELRKRGDV